MTSTAIVDSREYWNPTGIILEKGRGYSFEAQGEWRDGSNLCDANGWVPQWNKLVLNLVELSKRQRGQPLFKLIGAVEKNSPYIPLGVKGSFIAPASGQLFCFANDVPGFYGNNFGTLKLRIQAD
jgi:hypothetical protein